MSASLYANALAPFLADAERLKPAGAAMLDAHTHLGRDEDGHSLDLPTLLAELDDAGARQACVFPLHDPERAPSYTVPNDRVLAWAAESNGRLIPFCRLDPAEAAVAEGERCLAQGARGIKLHPRAQAFAFSGPEMDGVFALAAEASVPILVHAGRGMPPLADGLADLAWRHPDVVLILAHGAICDQGTLTSRLADHPGVLYDTSCFFPIDVLELFARVPAERIVFASDPPYGVPASGLYLVLRVAAHSGLDEAALRAVLGGTMSGLLDGRGLPPATASRRGDSIAMPGRLARAYSYSSIAVPALFAGVPEQAKAMLDLAVSVCRDPEPGLMSDALDTIGAALIAAQRLLDFEGGVAPAIDLLHRAMTRAATELPEGPITPLGYEARDGAWRTATRPSGGSPR